MPHTNGWLAHTQRKPEKQARGKTVRLAQSRCTTGGSIMFLQTWYPKPCPMSEHEGSSDAPPPWLYQTLGHQSLATLCPCPLPDMGPHYRGNTDIGFFWSQRTTPQTFTSLSGPPILYFSPASQIATRSLSWVLSWLSLGSSESRVSCHIALVPRFHWKHGKHSHWTLFSVSLYILLFILPLLNLLLKRDLARPSKLLRLCPIWRKINIPVSNF